MVIEIMGPRYFDEKLHARFYRQDCRPKAFNVLFYMDLFLFFKVLRKCKNERAHD
ncbi:MAG: hypothetical protein ACI8SR_001351 [Oceanicoccus sp.]|jgi:hypothetical protein